MDISMINFKMLGDERGHLISIESNESIPFDIKRVYYIYETKAGVERGFHAHKALNQVAIALSGSCEMEFDDGTETKAIQLNSREEGVYIRPGLWRVMRNFSEDCVLAVFVDAHYDEDDYIRDYDDFKAWVSAK